MLPTRATTIGPVRLERDEVHLWSWGWDTVESLDAIRGWLSDEDWRRGERFRRERDARSFLFRRAFLRRILARHVGLEPRDLVFVQSPFGKPFLARRDVNVRFSATSAEDRALLAVTAGREPGLDLEHERRLGPQEGLSALAERILTPGELARWRGLEGPARRASLLRAWTRKEAVLKALGTGLSREPGTVAVGLEPVLGDGLGQVEPAWGGWGQARDLDGQPSGFHATLVTARDSGPTDAPRLVHHEAAVELA